jgi:1,4-dihydroxy-2-naphthoate octaprenyltransferase
MANITPVRSATLSTPATRSKGRLPALVTMTRPSQIALIALVLANGILLGLRGVPVAPEHLVATLMASFLVVLAAAAVHLANEAADHETDRLAERTPFSGGSGGLEASGIDRAIPLRLALGLSAITAVVTIVALTADLFSGVAAGLLLAGLAGGLAYSLPPVEAMRRGFGEPLNALLGALMLPLFGVAVIAGAFGIADVIAFLPFFFVALASVMATAWTDRAADAATGKATMQVRLAPRTLRHIQAAAVGAFVAITLLSAAVDAMPLALAGLLVVPLLVVGLVRYTRSGSAVANVLAMVGLALITGAALVIDLLGGGTPR